MNELEEQIKEYLTSKSAELLSIEPSAVEWESDIDEYGFESMKINKLCVDINKTFGIEVRPAVLLEYTSLAEFSDYLKKEHYSKMEEVLM